MTDPASHITQEDIPQIIQIFKNDLIKAERSFFDIQIKRERSGNLNPEKQLESAVQYISQTEAFQTDVLTRILQVLEGLKVASENDKNNAHYDDKVGELESTVQKLKDNISQLQEHLYQQQYSNHKLHEQIQHLIKKNQQLKQAQELKEQQKREVLSHEHQVLVDNRQFEAKISFLENSNEQLLKCIGDSKIRMENISAETMQKEIKIIELERTISKCQQRLEMEYEKREKIEGLLEEKKQLINMMQEEMENNKISIGGLNKPSSLIRSFARQSSSMGIPIPISAELQDHNSDVDVGSFRVDPFIKRFSFEQNEETLDIPLTPTPYIIKASSNISIREGIEMVDLSPPVKKERTQPCFFNPYLAHYTLSCQSMKIILAEQGKNECLYINMDPKYKQLQGSKTPVHEWPTWIRKTLLQAIK